MSLEECMARKAEQGALQYAASVTEVNPPRIGGAGFISGVFNDFLANPRLPFNRLTPIGRWLGYFWDSKVAPLALNFADGTNTLDPRITFSRSSNATVTDSNGNIVFAPHNLLTFSEQFDNAAWNKNNATVTANATSAPDGTTTADKLIETAVSGNHWVFLNPSFTQGLQYTASVYAKAAERTQIHVQVGGTSAFGDLTSAIFDLSTQTVVSTTNSPTTSITSVGNGWYRLTVSKTATANGSPQLQVGLATGNTNSYTGDGTSGAFIWGAQLNVGSIQPYYPTTVKNLLGFSEAFENAAWTKSNSFIQTNLLTFSEQFDNAAWSKTNVSVTANNTLSPFGTSTADTIIPNTTLGDHLVAAGSIAATSGTVYTLSVYAKASGYNFIRLSFGNVAGGGYTFFDLSNGTVGTTSGMTSSSITPVGNGWYRCSVTRAASSTANLGGDVYITSANGQFNWSGNGTSGVALWGAQLVQGASAGDYVQTTSAALPVMYQAPNGTMTADKLVENTVNGGHFIAPASSPVLAAGQVVTYSVYAKATERSFVQLILTGIGTAGANLIAGFDLSNGTAGTPSTGSTSSITPIGNGWYRCSITTPVVTGASSTAQIRIAQNATASPASYTGDGTSGIYIWGAQLSDSASLDPYVNNPIAAPSSTAFYGPRFDYDPVTRQPRGLLIEEARTNSLLNSDTLSTQNVTVSAVPYTLSFYGTGSITLSGTSTGTLIGTGAYPNRVTLTFTPTAGTLTLTVSGSVRFAQLEAGAFATSYIPTTTATVTRAADVAVIQGSNFSSWYKYDEGTLLVEESLYAKNTSGFPQMPAFNDGTTNNVISIVHNGGVSQYNPYFLVRVSGVTQADMPSAGFVNPPINTPIKYAAAYKINDFAFTYMGANLTTDTSGSIPTVDRFNLSGFSGTAPIYIRRINYYNRRLDNSQLLEITR